MIIPLIILLFIIFFNSSEIAFVSSNKLSLMREKDNGSIQRLTWRLYSTPEIYFSTVLVGINLSLVFFSVYMAERKSVLETTLLTTFIVLIFGEILPKVFTLKNPEKLAHIFSLPLYIFYYIFYPIIFLVKYPSFLFLKLMRVDVKEENISRTEIEVVLRENLVKGVMKKSEYAVLKNVISLSKKNVADVMIPRINIVSSDIREGRKGVIEVFRKHRFTRIPIYRENIDNILGIVNIREVFLYPDKDIQALIKPVRFVPEDKTCDVVLFELLYDANKAAIVIDEYGGTAGFITLDDIFTNLVGEVIDIKKELSGAFILKGDTRINALGIEDEEEDTIAGYIIRHTGRIPIEGEEIDIGELRFKILDATDRKIKKVQVSRI